MAQDRIQNYADFFPFYLREHAKSATRAWHYLAAFASLSTLLWALLIGPLWAAFFIPVAGYAPAWISHAFIERNRPATFRYPFWSLISDYYMTWLWLTGGLAPKLIAAGVNGSVSQTAQKGA